MMSEMSGRRKKRKLNLRRKLCRKVCSSHKELKFRTETYMGELVLNEKHLEINANPQYLQRHSSYVQVVYLTFIYEYMFAMKFNEDVV